ncbi:MAG: NADH:flavin oxidoreductase [Pseudomonadota bacterium]
MSSLDALFQPFKIRDLEIPNRFVMAPMTRSFSPDGVPGEDVADYYQRRAAADVGLILSEGTTIDRQGASSDPRVPNFVHEDSLAGWRSVIGAVHEVGGKMGPQLWHVGMMRKPGQGPYPEADSDSPSGVTHTGKQVLPAPSDEEVADMVSAYAKAAGHAKDLGFDMIEIHGAHGYLIDQFFWSVMNQRDDRYGGSLEQRTEFAKEIIRQCRAAVGEGMPIFLRFSQWKQQDYTARLAETPEALESFLGGLADAGVDVFHCSQRRFWEPEFDGSDLNLAGWTRKLTGKPTVTVGSVGLDSDFFTSFAGQGAGASSHSGLEDLAARVDRDEFDLVAVGRALLHDPAWVAKVKRGKFDALEGFDAASLQVLT